MLTHYTVLWMAGNFTNLQIKLIGFNTKSAWIYGRPNGAKTNYEFGKFSENALLVVLQGAVRKLLNPSEFYPTNLELSPGPFWIRKIPGLGASKSGNFRDYLNQIVGQKLEKKLFCISWNFVALPKAEYRDIWCINNIYKF